jgi:DNA polymerase-1
MSSPRKKRTLGDTYGDKMTVKKLIQKIENASFIAFDTETVSLEDKTMVSFSFCCDGESFFIPVAMNTMSSMPEKDWRRVIEAILKQEGVIYHHYAFDAQVLRKAGFIPVKLPHDTLILAHLINENGRHKLKILIKEIFGHEMKTFKELCGTGKKQISFADADPVMAKSYGSEDAYWTYKLFLHLMILLTESKDLIYAYEKIERPLLMVVDSMAKGIPINKVKLSRITKLCKEKADNYFDKLQYYMGDVNLNSPLQLREYFINKRFQPILKRSRITREPSVDNEVLEKYAKKLPEATWLLKYRYYFKILNVFSVALSPFNGDTCIYAHFNQAGTTSGRFSSSNPNMQNIPKTKDKLGLRKCIAAPKGYKLVGFDYSGIEMRLVAEFSNEKILLDAFNKGVDIHSQVAKDVGCTRDKAKTLSYALLYGAGVNLISKQMNTTRDEAAQYIKNYYKKYPNIRDYITTTRKKAYEQGYLSIYGGRRRNISKDFESKTEYQKGGELRSLVNATIQGASATILKKAMISICEQIKKYDAYIILTVHDELITLVPEIHAQKVKKIMEKCMIDAGNDFKVKIEVEGGIGNDWSQLH